MRVTTSYNLLRFKMDFKYSLNYRTENTESYNNKAYNKRYDYASYGILNKCLPKILFKGNAILVSFLQLIDIKIIMLLKVIDKLKNFKNISSY